MLPKGKVWETTLLIRIKAYTGSNFLTPSSDKTDILSLRQSLMLFVLVYEHEKKRKNICDIVF